MMNASFIFVLPELIFRINSLIYVITDFKSGFEVWVWIIDITYAYDSFVMPSKWRVILERAAIDENLVHEGQQLALTCSRKGYFI